MPPEEAACIRGLLYTAATLYTVTAAGRSAMLYDRLSIFDRCDSDMPSAGCSDEDA